MLVIDASASVQFAASEPAFALLGSFELIAPPLMWSEALSTFHEAQWRRASRAEIAAMARD